MSAGSAGGDDNDQDFEINLAPIIDCFTVLITYLLVSASFISLSSLEVAVATASDAPPEAPAPGEPPPSLYVELFASKEIKVVVSGRNAASQLLQPDKTGAQPEWNMAALSALMQTVKQREPSLTEVNVKAEPTLKYKFVVRAVEGLKKHFPRVFIGE